MPSCGSIGALGHVCPSLERVSCGATCAAAAQRVICSKCTGPNVLPSSCLRRNHFWFTGKFLVDQGDGEAEAAAGVVGIVMVWPACNLRPSSMLLALCKSSTVTLYIFAMEVSVSPRETVCVLPPAAECGGGGAGAVPVPGAGEASPIITPGRECESCCSSFRIS